MNLVWRTCMTGGEVPREQLPREALVPFDHVIEQFGLVQLDGTGFQHSNVRIVGGKREIAETITVFVEGASSQFFEWHDDRWVG